MRVVREQMLCIVSAEWSAGAQPLTDPRLGAALRALFNDVSVVHFASLALLPAAPGAADGALPLLMLELAVDEGIRPAELLQRLVCHPDAALWQLYSASWPQANPAWTAGERNERLLARLLADLTVADGAFVGPRDRNVRQIHQEQDLLLRLRQQASTVAPQTRTDRRSFALELARWAFKQPSLEWANEAAPRSYWRGSGASLTAKLQYVSVWVAGWMAALWLLRELANWGAHALDPCAWSALSCRIPVVLLQGLHSLAASLMQLTWALLAALATAACLYLLFFVAMPALWPWWRRYLLQVEDLLGQPAQTGWACVAASGVSAFIAAFLVTVGLALVCVTPGTGLEPAINWAVQWLPAGWTNTVYPVLWLYGLPMAAAAVLSGICEGVLNRPEDDLRGLQQTHAMIEACEADLASGTNHIISLTEIRAPHAWNAFWARLSLRLVTWLGYVFFTGGRLGSASGIHYGHWHIIGNGRRLLFCSNYDGSFGGYLDDFIRGASSGTNLFWRWTELHPRPAAAPGHPAVAQARRFPPTRLIAFRGVKCEVQFKAYARDSMLPHLFRYDAAAIPLDQKILATDVRDAVFGVRTDAKDDQLMRVVAP